MARKNIFDLDDRANVSLTPVNDPNPKESPSLDRPLVGKEIDRPNRPAALGAISQSLEKINERTAKAEEIERQLSTGQAVVELDTDLLDSSFISDRLEFDDDDQLRLTQQIQEMGQMVPILVRPHPEQAGRYQIAYGHRRVAAARNLGRKVRATVKILSDEDLVIHQGQENNSRSNLSFIEKAFFVLALEKRGYSRETMYRSTGIDKAILSKMISFVRAIPEAVIRKIGRAPSIGRKRWEQFVTLLDDDGTKVALAAAKAKELAGLSSDERFEFVFGQLKGAKENSTLRAATVARPNLGSGIQPLAIQRTGDRVQFTFNEKVAPAFADFVQSRLDALFREYETKRQK